MLKEHQEGTYSKPCSKIRNRPNLTDIPPLKLFHGRKKKIRPKITLGYFWSLNIFPLFQLVFLLSCTWKNSMFSGPTQPCHPYVEGCFTLFDPVDMPADGPARLTGIHCSFTGAPSLVQREFRSDSENFRKKYS